MFIKSNPSRSASGFSYFFRNNKKFLFIRKPGGRKYYKLEVPRRVKPESFLKKAFIQLVAKDYFDYKVYYTKNGEVTNRRASADQVWIMKPKGRKFFPFDFPNKLKASEAELFTKIIVQEFQKAKRRKERIRAEGRRVAEEEFEEEVVPETTEKIEYSYSTSEGFYKSKKYGISEFSQIKAIASPTIKITKNNVDNFLDYVGTFGMSFVQEILSEMRVRENQSFRVRILGSGTYQREVKGMDDRVKGIQEDRFGFGLQRAQYSQEGFEAFTNKFMTTLGGKLLGGSSYLVRSANGSLIFEGFEIEIYD